MLLILLPLMIDPLWPPHCDLSLLYLLHPDLKSIATNKISFFIFLLILSSLRGLCPIRN